MTYEHRINVNIEGHGRHPILSMWCLDCLEVVCAFDQQVSMAELSAVATEHRSEPSKREQSRGYQGIGPDHP